MNKNLTNISLKLEIMEIPSSNGSMKKMEVDKRGKDKKGVEKLLLENT